MTATSYATPVVVEDSAKEKGVFLELKGNVPLLLNQGQRAWVVLAAGVDIFWVELRDGHWNNTR